MTMQFTCYGRPEPQGSSSGFSPLNSRRVTITSANKKLKPWRSHVNRCAVAAVYESTGKMSETLFAKHVPVRLAVVFTFRKPDSVPRKRVECVVKPDCDKLLRAICDALTGSVWHDDAQVIEMTARKVYGAVEGATVTVEGV